MTPPNRPQIEAAIRWALTGGGPIAALLVSRYGVDGDDLNLILTIALAVVPPAVSFVWSLVANTDRATIAAASAVDGVTKVKVDPDTGNKGALAAAADPKLANVTAFPQV